jgi:hypothetical protein
MLTVRECLFAERKYAHDPLAFCEETLGGEQPWARQAEALLALRDHPRVAVRSGHGVGKTWLAARAALWFLYAHPRSIVLTTAPTHRQVRSVLWAELRRQHRSARVALGGALTETRLTLDDDWFALGLSTDEPERFQGYHSEHLLLILDEAPGVPGPIYEAARGVLTSAHSRVLLIGNPTTPSGPFYEAFRSPEWRGLHIPCTACPNVAHGRVIYPKLVTAEWVEAQEREWGRGSPAFRSRVLGEFPEEAESRLAPLAWVHAAQERRMEGGEDSPKRMGVDVARYGADRTAIVIADDFAVREAHAWSGLSTMETAGRVLALARERGIPAERIAVDDTGVGGGVTDRLRELGWNVVAVQAAGAPASKNFANRRSEIYWRLREALNPEGESPLALPERSAALAEELTEIGYGFTSAGRIILEGKEAIRSRLRRSPDLADALALTFAVASVPASRDAQPRAWEM